MARIAKIMKNDAVNGIGVCVSLWTQGCPNHCPGCHNPETWDFDGGYEEPNLRGEIIKAISANNVTRNLSILGGEPLCLENVSMVRSVIEAVRIAYPQIKIFLWTGYTLKELQREKNEDLEYILNNINYLIDGRFIEAEKDLTLWLRGSRNQNVYKLTENKKYVKIDKRNDKEVEI